MKRTFQSPFTDIARKKWPDIVNALEKKIIAREKEERENNYIILKIWRWISSLGAKAKVAQFEPMETFLISFSMVLAMIILLAVCPFIFWVPALTIFYLHDRAVFCRD